MTLSLSEYIELLKKTKEIDTYKIYEKYAPSIFDVDLTDQKKREYWKRFGEAESYYGYVELFESVDSLLGNVHQNYLPELGDNQHRPSHFENVIHHETRLEIAKHIPNKCAQCGFHRFFGIHIEETSIGQGISIFCPNCRKTLFELEDNP